MKTIEAMSNEKIIEQALAKAKSAVIRVGDGRGFIVEGLHRLDPDPCLERRCNAQPERYVITAGHCLPKMPPCDGTSYPSERKRGDGMRPVRLRLPTARSKITNGVDLLPDVDQRSTWARRYADIRAQLIADRGGVEMVTCAEELLIRRASAIAVECERLESLAAQGVEDLRDRKGTRHRDGRLHRAEVHGRHSLRLAMVLKLIGLDRRARDITESLDQYLRRVYSQQDDVVDAEIEPLKEAAE